VPGFEPLAGWLRTNYGQFLASLKGKKDKRRGNQPTAREAACPEQLVVRCREQRVSIAEPRRQRPAHPATVSPRSFPATLTQPSAAACLPLLLKLFG
jgi:hypothetical protein